MPMFNMNPTEVQNGYNNAAANPYDSMRDSPPGFFEGSLPAIGTGLNELGVEAALYADPNENDKKGFEKTLQAYKPNPQTAGLLANLLQGAGSTVPLLAAGPVAGASLIGQLKGYAKMKELQAAGVDEKTAAEAGTIEGITQGGGMLVPVSLGGKVIARAGAGAGINIASGMANRGGVGAVLAANGYKDMADQYKLLDGVQMLTDGVLGGLFGAAHIEGSSEIPKEDHTPGDIDAALAGNNIHQYELDSAPGIPTDLATRNAHVDAMATATEQLLRDEPVNVDLKDHSFLPHPEDQNQQEFQDTIAQETKGIEPEQPLPRVDIGEEPAPAGAAEPAKTTGEQPTDESGKVQAAQNSEAVQTTPEITASERIAAAKPKLMIPGDEGTVSAKDALAKADSDIGEAKKNSALFEAAVNCLTRFQ